MAGAIKKSTYLTGLKVSENPHRSLGVLYGKIIRALQKLPKDYPYRIETERIIAERVNVINTTSDVSEAEKKIGCGQIEEVIIQADKELKLARNIAVWKTWESPVAEEPVNQWAWPPHK